MNGLTAERIQEIGETYGISLSGTVGTTFSRIMVFAVYIALVGNIVLLLTNYILRPFGADPFSYVHILTTLAGMTYIILSTLTLFFVNVPKLTGVILTNYFGGTLHVLGPGLQIKFPWEWNTYDDFIDTRAISVEKSSRFVVQGGTLENPQGAVGVTFAWTVQYGPFLPLLALYVRTEEKAITDGFEEVVENAISEAILGISLADILKASTVDELQEALTRAFLGKDVHGHKIRGSLDAFDNTLQERFGLTVELNTLGPPEFDKDYTEALSARVVHSFIAQDAEEMAIRLDMSKEKALQMLMILNKESVNQQIFTLQADEQVAAIAPVLMRALREVGDAGRGVQAGKGQSRRERRGGNQN